MVTLPPRLFAEGYLLSEKNCVFDLGIAASKPQAVLRVLDERAWGLWAIDLRGMLVKK